MRHFSKKQPVFQLELIQKISAAVYFIPVRVLFCKNFVGKVQSKCENAQKEPRKQICQQQTGYPRTLKTYIHGQLFIASCVYFLQKLLLTFSQSWMKYFHIDASQNRNEILVAGTLFSLSAILVCISFCPFRFWFCLLLHISYMSVRK